MPMINPSSSVASLNALRSLANIRSLGNQGLDVASGLDTFGPTDTELEDQQNQDATQGERTTGYGFTDSKDNLRADAMQKLRRTLAFGNIAHQQKVEEEVLPKQVEGEYGLKKQTITNAGEAQKQTLANTGAANVETIKGKNATDKSSSDLAALQSLVGGGNKPSRVSLPGGGSVSMPSGQVPGAVRDKLAAMRDAITKQGPGLMDRLRRRNPKLEQFDSISGLAQKIAQDYPDATLPDALSALGEDQLTPDEIGQLQQITLMLRGH